MNEYISTSEKQSVSGSSTSSGCGSSKNMLKLFSTY